MSKKPVQVKNIRSIHNGTRNKTFNNSNQLHTPIQKNRVALYYWSPGYKIQKEFLNEKGVAVLKKVFVPTTTFQAALAYLKNEYGGKKYLDFKEDAHPGHASIETAESYLSIGTDEPVGLITNHKIIHADKFPEDMISFLRKPTSISLHDNFFKKA